LFAGALPFAIGHSREKARGVRVFSRYAGKQKIKRRGAIIALLLAERFAGSDSAAYSAENRAAGDQRAFQVTIFFPDQRYNTAGGGAGAEGGKRETARRGRGTGDESEGNHLISVKITLFPRARGNHSAGTRQIRPLRRGFMGQGDGPAQRGGRVGARRGAARDKRQ